MRLLNGITAARGETLIGLMVGLAVGFVVLAGGIAFFVNSVSNNREVLQSRILNQDLKSTMDLMVKEIRRAQYIDQAEKFRVSFDCNDPFCDETRDFSLTTTHPTIPHAFQTIEFSYDLNDPDGNSSNDPTQEDNFNNNRTHDECFGFRRIPNAGTVEMKTDCQPTWTAMTDENTINVTDLSFLVCCSPSSGAAFYNRRVTIALTGQLVTDSSRSLTLRESVDVKSAFPASTKPSYCGACANIGDPCYPCAP